MADDMKNTTENSGERKPTDQNTISQAPAEKIGKPMDKVQQKPVGRRRRRKTFAPTESQNAAEATNPASGEQGRKEAAEAHNPPPAEQVQSASEAKAGGQPAVRDRHDRTETRKGGASIAVTVILCLIAAFQVWLFFYPYIPVLPGIQAIGTAVGEGLDGISRALTPWGNLFPIFAGIGTVLYLAAGSENEMMAKSGFRKNDIRLSGLGFLIWMMGILICANQSAELRWLWLAAVILLPTATAIFFLMKRERLKKRKNGILWKHPSIPAFILVIAAVVFDLLYTKAHSGKALAWSDIRVILTLIIAAVAFLIMIISLNERVKTLWKDDKGNRYFGIPDWILHHVKQHPIWTVFAALEVLLAAYLVWLCRNEYLSTFKAVSIGGIALLVLAAAIVIHELSSTEAIKAALKPSSIIGHIKNVLSWLVGEDSDRGNHFIVAAAIAATLFVIGVVVFRFELLEKHAFPEGVILMLLCIIIADILKFFWYERKQHSDDTDSQNEKPAKKERPHIRKEKTERKRPSRRHARNNASAKTQTPDDNFVGISVDEQNGGNDK